MNGRRNPHVSLDSRRQSPAKSARAVRRGVELRGVLAGRSASVVPRAAAVPIPIEKSLRRQAAAKLPDQPQLMRVRGTRQNRSLRGHLADDASAVQGPSVCQCRTSRPLEQPRRAHPSAQTYMTTLSLRKPSISSEGLYHRSSE